MSQHPSQLPAPSSLHIDPAQAPLPRHAWALLQAVQRAGGFVLVVGGFVRDHFFGLPSGDLDLEVYGLEPAELESISKTIAHTKIVGRDFGILKLGDLDVSLPRAHRQPGKQGFDAGNPHLTLQEAARRRDFTVNAMAWDPLSTAVYDPWGGLDDLQAGRLEVVDAETFVEDPLRALRMVQLVARFPLEPTARTLQTCTSLAPLLPGLPLERRHEELRKLLLKGRRIGHGLEVARRCGLVDALWPELARLAGVPGQPAWRLTLLALDQGPRRPRSDPREEFAVQLALLCHALDREGQARLLLERSIHDARLLESTLGLIAEHNQLLRLMDQPELDPTLRRLSARVRLSSLIELTARLVLAEHALLELEAPDLAWLEHIRQKAQALGVLEVRPVPIVQGRDLIALGMPPGQRMGELLKHLYELQLDGEFQERDRGLEVAARLVAEAQR